MTPRTRCDRDQTGVCASPTRQRWPGGSRREPRRADASYLVHRYLARELHARIEDKLERSAGQIELVLDVGCGGKPYFPWLEGRCRRYVGIDAGIDADVVAPSENLPFPADVADLVLCTQVLEHVDDPAAAIREISRVLRPGGLALVSTHGVQRYHPTPVDYWRWTASGLRKLAEDAGGFERVEVLACGGTVACLGFLAASYLSLARDRLHHRGGLPRRAAAAPLQLAVAAVNAAAAAVDDRLPDQRDPLKPNTLMSNLLLVAEQ